MSDIEKKSYEQILEENGKLVYTNVGVSMMPLLRQNRDLMIIERRPYNADGSFAPLKKFDAVLFKRGDKYVLHRIVAVHEGGASDERNGCINNNEFGKNDDSINNKRSAMRTYDILGDNQWKIEYGVTEDRILGVLIGVVKDGVESDFTDTKSRLYHFIYCDCLPLRRAALFCRDGYYKLGHEFAARTKTGALLKKAVRGRQGRK